MKRYEELDGLRAAAALAVVMIHVSSGLSNRTQMICNQLARFAVPAFFLLSGFGAAGKTDYTGLKKRLLRLLPPYFIWSAVYLAVDTAFGRPHARPLYELMTGGAYMHLYFMFVLVQLELISPLLCRAVRKKPYWTLGLSAAVSLGLQSWLSLGMLGKCTLPRFPIPMAFWCLPYLLFYAAGVWLAPRYETLRRRTAGKLPAAALLWLFSAAAVLYAARRWPALRGSSLRPELAVYTLCTAFCLVLFLPRVRLAPVRRAWSWISSASFALYLSHPLVLRLWNEWAVRQQPVPYLHLHGLYLLTAAGGLAIAWAVSVLPFGTCLGGRRKSIKRPE